MTDSGGIHISYDPNPIRLFQSDFLEFFTHIHPALVLAIWVPVAAWFLIGALRTALAAAGAPFPLHVLLGFVAGLVAWTLAEYLVHRFVFHFRPRTPRQERVVYLFHGIHHLQPQCKTRLVMPPAASIPMAVLFYGFFYLVVGVVLSGPAWVSPVFSGFIAGYVCYDMIHYATHHFRLRRGWMKALKRNHMIHHYRTPNLRFGVSSPAWDIVFGTRPA